MVRQPVTKIAPLDCQPQSSTSPRIVGFDLARSLAILGMIVVHFALVGSADHSEPQWLACVLSLLDGRAAATFMILAGIGLTLLTRRAVCGTQTEFHEIRLTVIRRGCFLLLFGFMNLTIWPGDILRVYGISLLVAAFLLRTSDRRLLILAASFVVVFTLLVAFGDYEKNWDWTRFEYRGLWTSTGILRNLFFDGFRSVLPWTGVMLFGMWLGRLDLTDRRINKRVLAWSAGIALTVEVLSYLLVAHFVAHPIAGMDVQTVRALFGTESMPALPLFLLAAVGAGTAVITLCVRLTIGHRIPVTAPLVAVGQMALTWYMLHIVLGIGSIASFGLLGKLPLLTATCYGLMFFAMAVLISWGWKQRFRHGPVEWLMRRIAG